MLKDQPANHPAPGTVIVTDKGLAGEGTEEFFTHPGLDLALIRPARKDEPHRPFPNWPANCWPGPRCSPCPAKPASGNPTPATAHLHHRRTHRPR
jgi:hypothetical protein